MPGSRSELASPVADVRRVLVVGASSAALLDASAVLAGGGYDVVHVTSYESGLSLLTADVPVDAVVLDATEASRRDLDVCRRFRLWNVLPHVASLVLLTPGAAAAEEVRQWADAVLEKPVAPAVLLETVGQTVEQVGTRDRLALRRQRSSEVLLRRTRELEAVRVLTGEVVRELDVERLRALIVRGACDLVGARTGTLWTADSQRGGLCPVAWVGKEPPEAGRTGVAIEGGAATGIHAALAAIEATAELVAPLVSRRVVRGAIAVDGLEGEGAADLREEGESLVMFAASAAIALENATLLAREVRQSEERQAILSALQVVLSGERLPDVLERLVGVTAELSRCPNVHVVLLDERTGELRTLAIQGCAPVAPGEVVPGAEGLVGQAMTSGETVYSANCQEDPRNIYRERARALGIVSQLCLPIRTPSRRLGVLVLCSTSAREYGGDDLRYLTSLADHLALAVEQSRLREEVQSAYEARERVLAELVRTEKLRALGELAAGMAHDLNNLLSVITGRSEVILQRVTDERTREAARVVFRAAADSMDVVRRVQSFARQEAPVSLIRCDLGQLVYEALELTRARWHDAPEKEGRPIRAVRRLGGLPAVLGTQSEIKEAVTNLIFNAVDAMPHGGTITFAGEEVVDDAKRRWVELRVSDTGLGIPEDLREKIFDPFFTTKGLHGTGLGLSVVWGIMKRLGGMIRAEQVAHGGAAFVLRFAVDESAPARTPVLESREVTTCRILIVDDDRTARRLLRTLLQSAGHSVIETDTVDAALAVIAEGRVDLVCTDIRMPGKDGFYLVRALQRTSQPVRVIVVTGFDTDAAEARRMPGIDAVIEKPLDVPTMLKAVTQVLARPAERMP